MVPKWQVENMGKKKGKPQQPAESQTFFLKAEPGINKQTVLYVERFTMSHVLVLVMVVFLKILSPQLGALSQDKLM